MTETSRFWDGTTVGDAVASPYDAETEFAQVLRDLRLASKSTNRGAVLASIGSGLTAAGTVGSVIVQDGYAFVQGTWYHSDAPTTFNIPTPGGATRVDRIVLRKDWTTQLVRLTQISGVEGGSEPVLTQAEGTTWDIPICSASITTGGVITTTDERDVAIPTNAGIFVPISSGSFPTTVASMTGIFTTSIMVPINGLPLDAVAAKISVQFDNTASGTDTLCRVASDDTISDNEVFGLFVGSVAANRYPMDVPITVPGQINISKVTSVDYTITIHLIGWYRPLY